MNLVRKLIEADRLTKKRIAVVGDVMTDVYVHGRLGTCQEESMKFVEESRVSVPGGAANAQKTLGRWNVLTNGLFQRDVLPVKSRFIVNGKCMFRHDLEEHENHICFDHDREIALNSLSEHHDDAILISDYDKGFLTPAFIRQVIELARERGIPVVADAKRNPEIYTGAIIKCNEAYDDKYEDIYSGDVIRVCTFGERPPLLLDGSGRDFPFEHRPYYDVQCVNHVGAGDCFAAHLALALAHVFSLEDAAAIAHSAGRCYVQHEHNRPPYPHEIAKDFDPAGGKVIAGSDLHALRQSNAGRSIVFAPGVFRIPHAGHVELLRWAKEQGDVLVVGVNSDESAARLKPGEFCLPLVERVAMLASMECVDWIVAFEDDTPGVIMELLRPDVMVKGPDYANREVCCTDLVKNTCIAPVGNFAAQSASGIAGKLGSK